MLEKIGPDIWLVEGEIVSFYGFPYPTRSIIVRLPDGGLWIWSPVKISPALKAEIDKLGPVQHLVGPNKIHHLFLADWQQAYPEARLWAPASLQKKRKDLLFEPPLENVPPAAWQGAIDQAWFRGSFFMDEIVFFHQASGTVILADLSENFSHTFLHGHWGPVARWVARTWKIVEGYGYAPLEWRSSFFRRKKARAALHKMFAWNPEKVVMAHGTWQREDGLAFLRQAFAWLEKPA